MKKSAVQLRGFTIVELLIVIVVIGILAALVLNSFADAQNKAKVSKAKDDLALIKRSMLAYKQEFGELPPIGDSWNYDTDPPSYGMWNSTLNALQTAKYLGSDRPSYDPWGNPYGYDDNDCNSGAPDGVWSGVRSVGPDGVNNTADDINVTISNGCSSS